MAEGKSTELDLRGYARMLRRRWWVLLLVPSIVAGVAYVSSDAKTPLYRSQADLLVARTQAESLFDPLRGGAAASDRVLANQVRVIKSQQVRLLAAERVAKLGRISASFSATEDVIALSAVDTDPRRARATVDAYATAYLDFRRDSLNQQNEVARTEISRQLAVVEQNLDALEFESDLTPLPQREALRARQATERTGLESQRASLQSQLTQLQAAINVNQGGAQLLAPAPLPRFPFEPQPERSALLGLVVGLMLAAAFVFLLEYLDDSLKGKEGVELAAGGVPVLGLIPALRGWRDKKDTHIASLEDPRSAVAEAYRSLRTSVQFLGLDRRLRIIQVTSPSQAEGKTTTISNLAVALANAGQRVVMVDADLRRPRIHAFFDVPQDVGLTSVLIGDARLADALQAVPQVPNLSLLASGPIPPNPSEMLASGRAGDLLDELAELAEVVLVDCPPVIPVTDALALAHRIDATLLVVDAGKTKQGQVRRAVELLGQVDAPLVGVVVNGVTESAAYGYGYGYGSGPNYTTEATSERERSSSTAAGSDDRDWSVKRGPELRPTPGVAAELAPAVASGPAASVEAPIGAFPRPPSADLGGDRPVPSNGSYRRVEGDSAEPWAHARSGIAGAWKWWASRQPRR